MEYVPHGAQCCGISHVYNFDHASIADLDRVIHSHDFGDDHGTSGNRMLEAVLTDRQLNLNERTHDDRILLSVRSAGGWGPVLRNRGFNLVTRFQNSNTGRYCNVFHRVSEAMSVTDNLPFSLDSSDYVGPIPRPTQPVQATQPTPVWSTERMTAGDAVIGLRVQYRIGVPGSQEFRNLQEGVITRVNDRSVNVDFSDGSVANGFNFNRFFFDVSSENRETPQDAQDIDPPVATAEHIRVEVARPNLTRETIRVGMRVRYVGNVRTISPHTAAYIGREGTVEGINTNFNCRVRWDVGRVEPSAPLIENLVEIVPDVVQAPAPIAAPALPAITVGSRVRYHGRGRRATPGWVGRVGTVTRMGNYISVREDTGYTMTPFLENIELVEQDTAPADNPTPELDPMAYLDDLVWEAQNDVFDDVDTETVEYFAIRRDGSRVGPFTTEEEARRRWSRVRSYVMVTTRHDEVTEVVI